MEKKLAPVCGSPDGSTEYLADAEGALYARKGGELLELAAFDGSFCRLRLWNNVPMLEIDGLRMHLVKDFRTPMDYAREVVRALRIGARGAWRGTRDTGHRAPDTVLDTCMGLGYTALEAERRGAASVTTCEKSDAVYTLASWNPWSMGLFAGGKITIVRGDISEEIKKMPDASFTAIIHDPPRFSKAGELYSLEFYRELRRVCRRGARLFHYVGSVGKGRGRDISGEAERRLAEAGFGRMRYEKRLQGILASA